MASATEVQETWRNYTRGSIGVLKLDHRGELTGHETVNGGYKLHITSLERRLNQEKVAVPDLDPFLNGMLIPLHLDPKDPAAEALLANPNIVSDEDMAKLVKGSPKAMVDRIERITNLLTLERIHAAALEDPNVTVRRVEAIKARITALRTTVAQQRRNEAERTAKTEASPRRRRKLVQPGARDDD